MIKHSYSKINLLHFYRWFKIAIGKSYYHQPQNIGKLFNPNETRGYFNDLIAKAQWTGLLDQQGIPVNIVLESNRPVYFATTIVQKALGHYDRWLLYNNDDDWVEFISLCDWLVNNQDKSGGWDVWAQMKVKAAVPYNAMTQGEVISAMVRAWQHTKKSVYRDCANKALNLMLLPVDKGGTTFHENEFLYLEEVPIVPRNTILNGWIFAIIGLHDYYLSYEDSTAQSSFIKTLQTLNAHIHLFDNGYWSYYDTKGHLASHIYHNLHIAQLTALSQISPNYPQIRIHRDKWLNYQKRTTNYVRALITKGIQKIKNPGEVTLMK